VSLALALYRAATGLAEPFAPLILGDRVKRGKEDPARLGERLGRAARPRPEGPLAWFHGASVGESLSLLPVIERLRRERPDVAVLATAGTTTAAELLGRRLPEGAFHQYIPLDAPGAARRFLDHWRPDLVVFAESDLWPNLLLGAKQRRAKLALVSARVGEDSAGGWAKAPGAAREVFGAFDLILPQDETTAARLAGLGARDDGRLNLKYAGDPLPADPAAVAAAEAALGGRPLLLAASTHGGEDEIMLDGFRRVAGADEHPVLVIVPRHPKRGPDIVALAEARGLRAGLRSGGARLGEHAVHVADTLGELGLWFRLARVALMGGSFVPDIGGHNPLEPARLGCPVVTGPHVENWQGVFDEMAAAGLVQVLHPPFAIDYVMSRAVNARDDTRAEAARAFADSRADEIDAGFRRIVALLP
jgi:3-deoxy-D-manno-octulosonic-acid transferase